LNSYLLRMKNIATLVAFASTGALAHLHEPAFYQEKFFNWMVERNVKFTNGAEFAQRLENFAIADDMIETHNAAGLSYTLAHNDYSHMSWEEFRQQFGLGVKIPKKMLRRSNGALHTAQGTEGLPDVVDWTADGAVTGVKNQGSCGSCWSFSTTGGLEGAYYLKNKNLLSFSEQQLVSCDTTDAGCNGGWMDDAFAWVQQNGGICTEDAYPYTSSSGTAAACDTGCSVVDGTAPTSWTDVDTNEDALQSAVAQQPVSVAIQANQLAFQFYSGGVLTGRCGTNLDHGVLLTGYSVYDDGTPYWIVKNSWGTGWGVNGYIFIEKGKDQEGGQCGIALAASYPSL